MTRATLDTWLTDHPYLKELARFQQSVGTALHSHEPQALPVPRWEDYLDDFSKGTPLLRARPVDKDVISISARLLNELADRLSNADGPEGLRHDCAVLCEEFRKVPDGAALMLEKIATGSAEELEQNLPVQPGLLRYLCWRTLESALRSWVESFSQRSGNIRWGRPFCPICGSLPAMAQLRLTHKGRERFLSCGCCRSRWSYLRTECPFCGNQDQDKLQILELEQEKDFRIDVCNSCNGYLKTCTREGDEDILLADWSTVHLDFLARQQGLQRHANSLYEL
jgi:FdhE protein